MTDYPTGEDLAQYMLNAGVITSLPLDYSPYDLAIAAAVQAWHKETRTKPFLADTAAADFNITVNNQTNRVVLPCLYTEINTVTVDDVDYTENADSNGFRAILDKGAYSALLFDFPVIGTITVNGKRGAVTELSSDIVLALYAEGARLVTISDQQYTGGLSEIRVDQVSYKYGDKSTNQHSVWSDAFRNTALQYRRLVVF